MTLRDCPECGTSNNRLVNSTRCYSCGYEWTAVEDEERVEKALGGA